MLRKRVGSEATTRQLRCLLHRHRGQRCISIGNEHKGQKHISDHIFSNLPYLHAIDTRDTFARNALVRSRLHIGLCIKTSQKPIAGFVNDPNLAKKNLAEFCDLLPRSYVQRTYDALDLERSSP